MFAKKIYWPAGLGVATKDKPNQDINYILEKADDNMYQNKLSLLATSHDIGKTTISEEILSHHEHWNGSGYPRGLEGEDIPYLARIISIIDAYDVITNDRPYSKAISKEEALAEIESCASSQFDPELAEVFVEMMEKENID